MARKDDLRLVVKPVVDYLRANYHPHMSILITPTSVLLSEDIIGLDFSIDSTTQKVED